MGSEMCIRDSKIITFALIARNDAKTVSLNDEFNPVEANAIIYYKPPAQTSRAKEATHLKLINA